jgi:hypothetical protein
MPAIWGKARPRRHLGASRFLIGSGDQPRRLRSGTRHSGIIRTCRRSCLCPLTRYRPPALARVAPAGRHSAYGPTAARCLHHVVTYAGPDPSAPVSTGNGDDRTAGRLAAAGRQASPYSPRSPDGAAVCTVRWLGRGATLKGEGMPGDVLVALSRWAGQTVAAALLPIEERLLGPEHPATLNARANLARWTGVAGDAAGPGTSSPPCCPSASGCPARSTRLPCSPGPTSPCGPGRRGMRPGPATSTPPCCPSRSGCWPPSTRSPWPPGTTFRTGRRKRRKARGGCEVATASSPMS